MKNFLLLTFFSTISSYGLSGDFGTVIEEAPMVTVKKDERATYRIAPMFGDVYRMKFTVEHCTQKKETNRNECSVSIVVDAAPTINLDAATPIRCSGILLEDSSLRKGGAKAIFEECENARGEKVKGGIVGFSYPVERDSDGFWKKSDQVKSSMTYFLNRVRSFEISASFFRDDTNMTLFSMFTFVKEDS